MVLVALVLYFAFRMTIEWYQADEKRRDLLSSRLDLAVAHTLGLTAILLFTVQSMLTVQLVDRIPQSVLLAFMLGVALARHCCSGRSTTPSTRAFLSFFRKPRRRGRW